MNKQLPLVALALVVGCGGGTTGTSTTTTTVTFKGLVVDSSGATVGDAMMSVLRDRDGSVLIDSGTDSGGRFAMELPGSENSYRVRLDGESSEPFGHSFEAPSSLRSILVSNSTTAAPRVSASLEVKFDESRSCDALEQNGETLIGVAELPANSSCALTFRVARDGIPDVAAAATLEAECEGRSVIGMSARSDEQGRIKVEIPGSMLESCSGVEVSIEGSGDSRLEVRFGLK